MYNFGSFDAFIVKPTILPEICSTILDKEKRDWAFVKESYVNIDDHSTAWLDLYRKRVKTLG